VTGIYEIGPFRLDVEAGVLTRAGVSVALGSRGVAVLTALVKRPGEYVQKGSILDAAWPGVVVEESNLAVQISAIRRVLARAPGGGRWIETLARRGYRFVGPVVEVRAETGQGAPGSKRSNLPAPLTSFIGRERELVEIKRLLPSARLLTLVGVGGIGKTRLALQAGAEVVDAYRDGVWFVDLAPLADPPLVPSAVAQALGVREAVGKALIDTLCGYLKGRRLLLLLDNCEHLLQASAGLAEAVLQQAAGLTIIATSREPLRVTGEQMYSLPTLSLPDPAADAETVGRSEAVRLFMERAQRQQPGFALTPARALVVAELCIHLDGIPLALELAAARIRSLSVEQIHARLDNRFRLLTSGGRTALPRQQTLRATLDWSFDLLVEEERVVLRRFAVFAGGFTLEAASAVTSDAAIDEHAVIDLLSQLVARSLVMADTSGPSSRYRLLETTRAYALEKLADAGGTDAIRRRHAEYFRALFEGASGDWWRMPDADWRARYFPELDNVRAALDWALGSNGDAALGVALAGASRPLWTNFAFSEGVRRLEAAAARVESFTPESHQAPLWLALGILSESEPHRALGAFDRAVEMYRRLGDASGLGVSLNQQARMLARMNRIDEAESALKEALPALERVGLPKALGYYYAESAFLRSQQDDPAGAKVQYEKSLSFLRSAGAELGVLIIIGSLAGTNWALGDIDAAIVAYRDEIALMRNSTMGGERFLGFAFGNLAGALTECGRLEEAIAAVREGLPMLRNAGFAWVFLDHFALRAALAGKVADAALLASYADAIFVAKTSLREPNEARARDRLHALLREKLAPGELERLLAEGARLSEEDACRLALED
jgi:predicted ATPase/DNA-binding winged helix-turn-helix (wHTH) protein